MQKDTADSVARHLVAAGSLVEEDPALALEHARYARRRASRIAVVREAAGIAAYHAGEWAEALAELRAARRMGGGPVHLPVMADIERALGRPERAVDIARGTEAAELDTAGRIELAIVGAGARRDLGELDAAVVGLQIPELDPKRREPWSARLFYAYADNLLAAGRESDALQWFVHAADADIDGETDAVGRIAVLTGEDPDDADDFAFGFEDVDVATEVAGDGEVPVDDLDADATPAEGAVDGELAACDVVDELRTEPAGGDTESTEADVTGADAAGASDIGESTTAASDVDATDVDVPAADAAELDGAELDGAELDGAELDGAELDGAELDEADVEAPVGPVAVEQVADEVVADEVGAGEGEADALDGHDADADDVVEDASQADGARVDATDLDDADVVGADEDGADGDASESDVADGVAQDADPVDAVDGEAAGADVADGDASDAAPVDAFDAGEPEAAASDSADSDAADSDAAGSSAAGVDVVDEAPAGNAVADGASGSEASAGEAGAAGDGAVR